MPAQPVFLVALYSPKSEVEILLLRSVFDGSGLDFFITTDTFGAMTLTNRHTLLVAEDQLDEARGLLDEFRRRVAGTPPPPRRFWRRPWRRFLAWVRRPGPVEEPPRLCLVRDPDGPSPRDREPGRSTTPAASPPELRLIRGGRDENEPTR